MHPQPWTLWRTIGAVYALTQALASAEARQRRAYLACQVAIGRNRARQRRADQLYWIACGEADAYRLALTNARARLDRLTSTDGRTGHMICALPKGADAP